MLRELHLKNLAIVGEARLEFGPGLTLLTGETGAGKSIVVDGLLLAAGQRASSEMLRSGEGEASVECVFDLSQKPALQKHCDALGLSIDPDEKLLVISRKIKRDGQNRAFVNNSTATLNLLTRLCDPMLNIHGQGEAAFLLDPDFHRDFLDRFGGLVAEREKGVPLLKELFEKTRKLRAIESGARDRAQRMDTLRFQIQDIETGGFERGDDESLKRDEKILAHSERFATLAGDSLKTLEDGESPVLDTVSRLEGNLEKLTEIDAEFSDLRENISDARAHLEDLAGELRNRMERYEFSPERLNEVQSRLHALSLLEKKYGPGLDKVLDHLDASKKDLEILENEDRDPEALRRAVDESATRVAAWAGTLSKKRRASAKKLEKAVLSEFEKLALEKARFELRFSTESDESSPVLCDGKAVRVSEHGWDTAEFFLSPNPGEELKPLAKIASGGELSRIMLALKTALLPEDSPRVLVFDEVDAGIGGRVAEAVGERLKALSKKHQVLCVTHLPQIAALADTQFQITKVEKNGKTFVEIKALAPEERVEEIARMLAGRNVTSTARDHARELLGTRA